MTHEDYLRKAIEVAQQSEAEGGAATGAILVKDGKIIATGKSTVWQDRDPSGHSEGNCIRTACRELDTTDLSNCVMYGTLEPCGMCTSCATWANLSEIYFGAYRNDVSGNEYEIKDWDAEAITPKLLRTGGEKVIIQGGILREACAALLKEYRNWQKQ